MATFIPEDGTGIEDANAYATLEFVRAYHEARGQLAAWDGEAVVADVLSASSGTNQLELEDHDLLTGDGPLELAGDDLPAGVDAETEYWAVRVDDDHVKLAASYDDAVATIPVVVSLVSDGSGDMVVSHADFAAQRAAIVRATDYLERRWGGRFRGEPSTSTQGLHWPASSAYLCVAGTYEKLEGVPVQVQRACAEYALRALAGELEQDQPDGGVTHERVKDGPAEREVTYARGSSGGGEYPAADRWLRDVVDPPTTVRY